MNVDYDVVIVGAGPSGVSAGIYAKRSGLKTLIIEKNVIGGQVVNSSEIKNFPGFTNITGPDFAYKLYEQLNENELEVLYTEPLDFVLNEKIKKVVLKDREISCKVVIFCVGAKVRPLGLINEEELTGKGVSYCAICDGNFYKNKVVAVVGGGDSALEDSIYLSGICDKVFVIVRKNVFKGQEILVETLKNLKEKNQNIEVLFETQVKELISNSGKLSAIKVLNKNEGEKILNVEGLFIAIGRMPATENLKDKIELNEQGYIIVDDKFQTSVKGVFAGGDCINKDIKQILTASSFGALASTYAFKYIKDNF